MPPRTPPSRRKDRRPNRSRSVQMGIVPYRSNCSRLGVLLMIDGEQQGCIPPDEARYLASDEEDPMIRRHLLEIADFIDNLPAKMLESFPGETEVVPPTVEGPEALKAWIILHRDRWRDAYRKARQQGFSAEVIVMASPGGAGSTTRPRTTVTTSRSPVPHARAWPSPYRPSATHFAIRFRPDISGPSRPRGRDDSTGASRSCCPRSNRSIEPPATRPPTSIALARAPRRAPVSARNERVLSETSDLGQGPRRSRQFVPPGRSLGMPYTGSSTPARWEAAGAPQCKRWCRFADEGVRRARRSLQPTGDKN